MDPDFLNDMLSLQPT